MPLSSRPRPGGKEFRLIVIPVTSDQSIKVMLWLAKEIRVQSFVKESVHNNIGLSYGPVAIIIMTAVAFVF